MRSFKNIGNLVSYIICKNIDWLSCLFLFPWFYGMYAYFFKYDEVYYPYALHFQHYTEINWVAWVFLLGHYGRMKRFGRVTVIGCFFILIGNSYQLHVNFKDTQYLLFYIAAVFVFIVVFYFVEIFRAINSYPETKYKY